MGDYRSGLAYLQQALRIARTLTSHQGRAALQATASCLLDLSILYSRQAAYGAALRYAQQASEQFAQLNDATGQANAEYRVAKRALQLGDTAQAGGAAHASLRRAGVSNQRSDRRDACDIFGLLAFARHQLVAARTWHQEALQIDQKLGTTTLQANDLTALARVEREAGHYPLAIRYAQQAARIAAAANNVVSAQQAEEQLAGLYDQLGDAPRALTHFRRFISLRDSIRNADNEKATLQQRLGYEYDLKETSLRAA